MGPPVDENRAGSARTRSAAGSLVAFVSGYSPAEAMSIAHQWLPLGWDARTIRTSWGTALLAGPVTAADDGLIAFGTAVADPWGLPGTELGHGLILERFARYGDHVLQLAAGPFVVGHLTRGCLGRALNGIVPVFMASGPRIAIGTHGALTAALAGAMSSRPVPPGCVAHIDGATSRVADISVWEALPRVTLSGLARELEYHIARSGRWERLRKGPFVRTAPEFILLRRGTSIVASPRLSDSRRSIRWARDLASHRFDLGRLWWQTSLQGMTLFAPAFERPALDTLTLAIG